MSANKPAVRYLPYQPESVARALAALLEKAARERGVASLAIPGGRTPAPVLTALAGQLSAATLQNLVLLWLDERAVPLGHADRNDAATLKAWSLGGALPARVLAMPAERPDLEAARVEYATTLKQALGGHPIDACFIGIGEDGHFASLFPDHPALDAGGEVLAIYDSPKPPPRRLTLSLPMIRAARQRFVVALGAEKGRIFLRASQGPDRKVPVSLLPEEGTEWRLDDEAQQAARGG